MYLCSKPEICCDQMHLFQHGSVDNFGTPPPPSHPAFHLHLSSVSTLLTLPFFALSFLSLIFSLFSSYISSFFPFLASSAFEPAYCMNHQSISENKISSLNGQRAFSALLAKSRELNKQVLKGTQHSLLSNYFTLVYLCEEP